MNKIVLVTALLGGVWLTGCGGILGSCTQSENGLVVACTEYEELPGGKDTARQSCTSGTFADAPCVATNRVGRCRVSASAFGVTVKSVQSFYAPGTAEQAQTACTALGGNGLATATFIP